ncbi:PagK family vesicle-borne virulence factor [Salmonella enterica]|uniref:Phage virulence factor n=1 Tax=Salmonella enterica subsp. enterica serovar Brandenburg TaxID=149387 RepID=A0A5J2CBG0_SALET|nr:phage virulence factor [Salmonella enterica subsp. enterica serovar Brandenburg]EDD2843928.1 phage virulence factor [Salmonella enterica subsp. enterica serovar Brandenburg]
MKHVKSVFLAMVLILPPSLYSALTIAADSQEVEKAQTIKPAPPKWCDIWPGGVPMLSDWFKICRGY